MQFNIYKTLCFQTFLNVRPLSITIHITVITRYFNKFKTLFVPTHTYYILRLISYSPYTLWDLKVVKCKENVL